jgi:hypothetical protein
VCGAAGMKHITRVGGTIGPKPGYILKQEQTDARQKGSLSLAHRASVGQAGS